MICGQVYADSNYITLLKRLEHPFTHFPMAFPHSTSIIAGSRLQYGKQLAVN